MTSGQPSCGSDCGGDGTVTDRHTHTHTRVCAHKHMHNTREWQCSAPGGVTVWSMHVRLRLYMCMSPPRCPLPEGYQPWPQLSLSWTNWVGRNHATSSYNIHQGRRSNVAALLLHEWGLPAAGLPARVFDIHKLVSCISTHPLFDAISSSHNLPMRENLDHLLSWSEAKRKPVITW